MNRREVLGGFTALSLLGLAGCSKSSESKTKSDWDNLTLNVATYKGAARDYMAEAGVKPPPYTVKYAELGGGNLTYEAIASGTVDVGPMSEIPPIFGIERHMPVKIIGVLRGDVNNQAIIVPEHSTIRSIEDLKGKRVGYVRSTTSHYLLLKVLKEKGLSFDDIIPVALTPQDGSAAFQSGKLDAWSSIGYYIQLAQQKSNARILKTGLGYLSGNFVIAANAKSIADPRKHAAITDYILREYQVWNWIQKHPEEWATKTEQLMGVPKALFLEQFKHQSQPRVLVPVDDAAIQSQQEVADVFFQAGLLKQHVDVSGIWDRSFKWG
ncbi:ABC transporter substrate-binding protein [Aquirhabdus sp.]|uniref:ABC transporter substrate-binding protein n=1 Tax=Aquirhabdus sp. TaxID=2824160 RepID=UPI00396C553F